MFDMHSSLETFFREYVRLKPKKVDELDTLRRKNIERLNIGLGKLGYNGPVRVSTQGGRAMKTMNQIPENNPGVDYDIDVAVIFERYYFPINPLDARKRVLAGVIAGGGNFSRDPEFRTNAVTIWYQGGYHVDLAVHRVCKDTYGYEVIEHAGAEWCRRDPTEITEWFNRQVVLLSPTPNSGATVAAGQMRRIVQLLKYFSKSHPDLSLPGGLIISTLVSEKYVPDYARDDISLYKTMRAIYERLQASIEVNNPVDSTYWLTYKDEYRNQVIRLRDKIYEALETMSPLFGTSCDSIKAANVWGKVLNHSFWKTLEEASTGGEIMRKAILAGNLYTDPYGRLAMMKPSNQGISIGTQICAMKSYFPQFKYRRNQQRPSWIGWLQPTKSSPKYQVELVYHAYRPEVWVLSPSIEANAPHRYPDESLCLYYPEDRSWTRDKFIHATIIPWVSEWLYFYELWCITGRWYGPEAPHLKIKRA